MTVPSPEEQARNSVILGPSYQNLMARYGSNRATQWQVFVLGLTAQGFMIGAASQVVDRVYAVASLCIVIFFIGIATIGISLRFNIVIDQDRALLDEYERILLVEAFEPLRLRHSSLFWQREYLAPMTLRLRMSRSLGMRQSIFGRFVMRQMARSVGSRRLLFVVVLELVIFIAAAGISIFGNV
ncbi:MAG: hypothetical protein ACRDTG_04700 [Pseudonocardiaceae bacterium]